MTSVWLTHAFRTGSVVSLVGLFFGCALETSAIGLADAGDTVAGDSVERPTPRKDASTQASNAADARASAATVQQTAARPNDAGDVAADARASAALLACVDASLRGVGRSTESTPAQANRRRFQLSMILGKQDHTRPAP